MSTHQMSLQPKYFHYIRSGTKRIELRLFDEKRQRIRIRDVIEFTCPGEANLRAKVVGLLRYNSFEDLFECCDIAILADASMTKQELLEDLGEFYTPARQARDGVLGIHLRLI